ncbi:hypothetical protein [Rhizobium leguminosarum]
MDQDEKKRIGEAIQRYIVGKKLSREGFAHKVGISLSNVNKMVTGLFTEKGLIKVEQSTGVRFQTRASNEFYGNYTFADLESYQGTFEYLRYSFQDETTIVCFSMRIDWSDEDACLRISHKGIGDSKFKQFGHISRPKSVPYIVILSNVVGHHSLTILGVKDFTRVMHGGMYAIAKIDDLNFAPRFLPVALCGTEEETETRDFKPGDGDYERYRQLIEKSRLIVADQAPFLFSSQPSSRSKNKPRNLRSQ